MPQDFKRISKNQEVVNKQEKIAQPKETLEIAVVGVERKFEEESLVEEDKGKKGESVKRQLKKITGKKAPGDVMIENKKSQTLEQIEDILQEDLEDIYFQMPENKKAEFKRVGEQTSAQIENLLGETKIKIKKILELIMNWLKIIPGVNKFFLEQEAKIKTDKILDFKDNVNISSDQDQDKNKI